MANESHFGGQRGTYIFLWVCLWATQKCMMAIPELQLKVVMSILRFPYAIALRTSKNALLFNMGCCINFYRSCALVHDPKHYLVRNINSYSYRNKIWDLIADCIPLFMLGDIMNHPPCCVHILL